jgi:hypothetical protein
MNMLKATRYNNTSRQGVLCEEAVLFVQHLQRHQWAKQREVNNLYINIRHNHIEH